MAVARSLRYCARHEACWRCQLTTDLPPERWSPTADLMEAG
jgi:hypothetical protein